MPERRATPRLAGPVLGGEAVTIGPLVAADRSAAVDVLARAFRDNPISRAVVGEGAARRLRVNRAGLRSSLVQSDARSLTLVASCPRIDVVENPPFEITTDRSPREGSPRGVLMAFSPGSLPLPPPSLFEQLRLRLAQGRRVAERWSQVYRRLAEVHPDAPHWYLSVLGVDPACQGRGLGRLLLDRWLQCVDRAAAASYLETDRERNLALYRRAGFAVRAEIRVLGIDVWCMWRPPGPAAGRST